LVKDSYGYDSPSLSVLFIVEQLHKLILPLSIKDIESKSVELPFSDVTKADLTSSCFYQPVSAMQYVFMNNTLCKPKSTNPKIKNRKFTNQTPSLIFVGKGEANLSFWKFEEQTNNYLKLLWQYDRPAILLSELPTTHLSNNSSLWQVTLDLAIGFRYKASRRFTAYGQQQVQLIMLSYDNQGLLMSSNYASAKYLSEAVARAIAKELMQLSEKPDLWEIARR